MKPVPFADATDQQRFGGKVRSLGVAAERKLPVPPGFGLSTQLVAAVAAGDSQARDSVLPIFDQLSPAVAVRSSAVGEDSADASFAGQHLTVLNVTTAEAMVDAIGEVHGSAHSDAAFAYRKQMNIEGAPQIAVAVQKLVHSHAAGVMFTRHPISAAPELYIEGGWGLGEAIVAGLIVPDTFRVSLAGEVLEQTPGDKDLQLVAVDSGVEERAVTGDAVSDLCITADQIAGLHELAHRCMAVYGEALDIEWAVADGELYLLQCRAITI